MAITQDGAELFGINTPQFKSMVVESFSLTSPANRVDLDDGDGEPLGATIVPQRQDASLTVQMGDSDSPPTIGESVTYGSFTILVTSVDLTEAQADYRRYSISGYVATN
tara:strand:- start:2888 stop:3214 length:327 start_codon:yes stop_codon:yes gene_type:complete